MMDYHTHHIVPQGGYLNATTLQDWQRTAAAPSNMIPCFGQHPWHAAEADVAQLAFELDDWLTRYPQAGVGECGLDASPRWASSLEAQRIIFHLQLGAGFRHERLVHIHGVNAWAEILTILQERQRNKTLPNVLLHAWNGSHEMAREFLKLGAIFSVGLRELSHTKAGERYSRIPHDKIFAESDDKPESFAPACALLSLIQHPIS